MQKISKYNTKQREALLKYIISIGNNHVTATQIINYFKDKKISIGRTTVYRHLYKLIQDGIVRKYNIDGISGFCYQYINNTEESENNLILKCYECGELYNLKCNIINESYNHIYENHTFQVDTKKTIFYGKCKPCLNNI